MKKNMKRVGFLSLGLLLTALVACSEDTKESCDRFDRDVASCSADDITACCDDGGSCYYVYKGKEYSDVNDLAAVCQSGSAMHIEDIALQLDNFTLQLIEEARTAALCN
ncbi:MULTISPECIES: hypothetical protein [unclassified Carboxylicivirga]|uniref:hypothetical protein n=1 Tax=Carboxylicivirga TaxID=1628153 RepID=UPI003D344675